MHQYRTHNCGELTEANIKTNVRLSGWIHSKRDHGSLLFIDLRDQYGITQIVVDKSNKIFNDVVIDVKMILKICKQNKEMNLITQNDLDRLEVEYFQQL